jgi:hypothetical protein
MSFLTNAGNGGGHGPVQAAAVPSVGLSDSGVGADAPRVLRGRVAAGYGVDEAVRVAGCPLGGRGDTTTQAEQDRQASAPMTEHRRGPYALTFESMSKMCYQRRDRKVPRPNGDAMPGFTHTSTPPS